KRELLEGANEVSTSGNGITGNDETTENILVTWDTIFVAPDPGVVGPGVPVELSSFAASVSENSVTLNWATATELNNSGFDILRKDKSNQWNKIGFVPGFGTSSETHSYTFADKNLNSGQYAYRLKQVDFAGSSELSDVVYVDVTDPARYGLSQNYPNPFNPNTTIKFSIPEASNVTLKVFNTLGEEISVLVNRVMEAGTHEINFDASQLHSGIYFYRIDAGAFSQVKKMTLLK
ncbi:MAG: T9SS type A sorting domain-containing protein, partial [Ignavibacteriaceae bacterium]